jgi:hypothetical protein
MRVLIGFVLLFAGVGALAATIAEPNRYRTDMISLNAEGDRLAGFTAAGQPAGTVSLPTPDVAEARVAEASPVSAQSDEWAARTSAASASDSLATADNSSALDSATREALARDIQGELARLGCYAGPLDGVWSAETQRAAGLFATEANARIPVSEPDFALFSLAKTATDNQACGPAIVAVQKPIEIAPAMGLGGPAAGEPTKPAKSAGYRRDRDVEALFTNPLGR